MNIEEKIEAQRSDEPNTEINLVKNITKKKSSVNITDYVLQIKDDFYRESSIEFKHYREEKREDKIQVTIKTRVGQPTIETIQKDLEKSNIPKIAMDLERTTGYDLPYTNILLQIHEDFKNQGKPLFKNLEKKDLPYFTDNGKFVPLWLAQDIMEDHHFATHKENDQLYIYQNGVYKTKGETKIKQEAQKRLGRYRKNHWINETLETIRIDNYIPKERFNNPNNGLVVENGLLDLKRKRLKPHSPDHIHITKLPWSYDPEADCPEIKEFIGEVVHEDDIKLIQEMFGYCLLRDYPYAKAFMLLGSGANGKSTLIDLLEQFLGEDNIAGPSLQDLLNNRFAKIQLHGKLANTHADLSSSKLESTGTFKMLTGGDTIQGEKKHQDPIEFKNHAKLIYSANELPKTTDRTEAFFRRWIVIEFPNQFTDNDEDTDPNLPDSLINEESMSGLLNWALEGLDRIKEQNGFSMTESRKEIEEKWILKTDSLRAFANRALKTEVGKSVSRNLVYEAYKKFCDHHDVYIVKKGPVTKKLPTILPEISKYRPKVGGKQVRSWKNLTFDEDFVRNNDYIHNIQGISLLKVLEKNNNIIVSNEVGTNTLDISDTGSGGSDGSLNIEEVDMDE